MQRRWSYPHLVGSTQYQHTVALDGETVTSDHPERLPNPRVTKVREVFEQSAFFEARDPEVRFELLAAIAALLSPEDLARPIDRQRLAYLRAYDPKRVKRERFAYVLLRNDRSVERACDWLVDPHGIFTTSAYGGELEHYLPDEVFLAGPPTIAAPAWHREQLRARLYSAQTPPGALAKSEGFRSVCYRKTPRRDWTWGGNNDGESYAMTAPGCVTVGYQYRHDMGSTSYVPERVLCEPWSTRISLGWPDAVGEAARAALLEAGEEQPLLLDASVSECAEWFATNGRRVGWDEPWPHAVTLEFAGFERVFAEKQWQGSAAMGLFSSLSPDKRLSLPCDHERAGAQRLYGFGTDELWLSTDGAAVLRAADCFGTWAGGVEERWHIVPSADRRVVFAVATDYSQNAFTVVLGADTADALAALRAHCEAYFAALGLGACVERARSAG
jgi:hypothetical protein